MKLEQQTIERLKQLDTEQKKLVEQVNIIESHKRVTILTALEMMNADLSKSWQLTEDFEIVEKIIDKVEA